jgi:hypothetical protein
MRHIRITNAIGTTSSIPISALTAISWMNT